MPTINLALTEIGYRAIFARYPQVRLKLVRAEFTEFTAPYVPDPNQTSLVGPTLFTVTRLVRQLNHRNDLIFKIVLPDTAPNAVYHEIGIFAENSLGETFLFAVGALPTGYVKDRDFQLLFVCYLRAPVFNYSVEFEANTLADIPVVDTYGELPPANRTGPNVWTVRNGRECGPAMVCKAGDMNEWALINGSKVYVGPIVVKNIQIDANVDLAGTDAAMITVIRGSGMYQTRRINTMKQLDKPFTTDPDADSVVAIWTGPGCC